MVNRYLVNELELQRKETKTVVEFFIIGFVVLQRKETKTMKVILMAPLVSRCNAKKLKHLWQKHYKL